MAALPVYVKLLWLVYTLALSYKSSALPTLEEVAGGPAAATAAASDRQVTVPAASPLESAAPTGLFSDDAGAEPAKAKITDMPGAQNIFEPLARDPLPATVQSRDDHPLKKEHFFNDETPVDTNKFYANFYLGNQGHGVWTHPYSLSWAKANASLHSYGLAVSHVDNKNTVFGPIERELPNTPSRFYFNPLGIWSFILGASEFDTSTSLDLTNTTAFSARAILSNPRVPGSIGFPLVQGMGFVTAEYNGLTPLIQSIVFYRSFTRASAPKPGIDKYQVTLNNGTNWLIYVSPEKGSNGTLQLRSNSTIVGSSGFRGIVQVARNPSGPDAEEIYDRTAGAYPIDMDIAGAVDAESSQGAYRFAWRKGGGPHAQSNPLLMFASRHHLDSFDDATRGRVNPRLTMHTTSKGNATACLADSWTMVETDLPTSMGFGPWSPGHNGTASLSENAKSVIAQIAPSEIPLDMTSTNSDSMYFSGKALTKYAQLVYVISKMLDDSTTAAKPLQTLKDAFATFVENRQMIRLVYDSVWKGVVSEGSYRSGDPIADFGNTYYNDHHFHYGYFILTAAIIGDLDPDWLTPENKAYINMLVRDSGNPSADDPLFPFSRGFDWFHGHSWAKGLFESGDGKDQESSSEDAMYAYAIKMWGKTTGDASMEARGNLMLGILRRSLSNYFLMENNNTVQPRPFIGNKVTGILFENKVDHATYFGANLEYVQGIHMLPLLPCSPYVRSKTFVREEWDAMFAPHAASPASAIASGWKGVLYANLAIADARASWDFFANPAFRKDALDEGATRSWYLAFAAGLGGA